MIENTLNRKTAETLFDENAIFFNNGDAVPEKIVYELFGTPAAEFYKQNNAIFVSGRDYNITGSCNNSRPPITYFKKSGFMKFVAEHNYLLLLQRTVN